MLFLLFLRGFIVSQANFFQTKVCLTLVSQTGTVNFLRVKGFGNESISVAAHNNSGLKINGAKTSEVEVREP